MLRNTDQIVKWRGVINGRCLIIVRHSSLLPCLLENFPFFHSLAAGHATRNALGDFAIVRLCARDLLREGRVQYAVETHERGEVLEGVNFFEVLQKGSEELHFVASGGIVQNKGGRGGRRRGGEEDGEVGGEF
jgi:hypothetical protein